jgi:tol-pal system protein YbgF
MTNPTSRVFAAAALAAALGLASATAAQETSPPRSVFDRMFGGSRDAGTPDGGGLPVGQVPATELVLRIERLEAQIRQLTGTIEQLQHRNRQLEEQLRRAEDMAGPPATPSAGSAARSAAVPAAPTPAPVPGRRSDVFDPTLHPNAPGAPQTLGTLPAQPPSIVAAEPPIGVPGGRAAGEPLDLSTLATVIGPSAVPAAASEASEASIPAPPSASGPLPPPPARNPSATGAVAAVAPPSESPKDYYDLGYGYVLRKDYALAERTFDAFLKKFPDDRRAADAQFWLGESLFQRQRYDEAASAFLDLSTRHRTHAKAPESLLRLGQSLAALNQKEMACATLAEVGRKYPRAPINVKQGVEREQKRVRC